MVKVKKIIPTENCDIELNITPLSVNCAWKGRRFATKEYKDWTEQCLWYLKKFKYRPDKPYKINIEFYQSKSQDIDSCIKMILDVLVKSGIIEDDRYVDELNVKKIGGKDRRIKIKFL